MQGSGARGMLRQHSLSTSCKIAGYSQALGGQLLIRGSPYTPKSVALSTDKLERQRSPLGSQPSGSLN